MKVTFFNGATSTTVTTAPQIISGGAALPPGVEGQVLGYGPGGVPRALDAAGPPYDDTGIKQRVQTLESTVAGKADVGHGHAVSAITGLQGILDGKAAVGHQHDLAAVSGLQAALDGKASATHTHGIAGVTGLQGALDGKAAASHQHDIAGVSGLQDIIDALTARIEALEDGTAPVLAFVAQPTALRVYQRATSTGGQYGKGAADIPVTVTTDSPIQSLEYRLRDADQPATTLVGWTAAAGAGAAGARTITVTAPARLGDYLLDVRANADPAAVISSPNRFGVGAVILVAGQSQAVRTIGSFPAQAAGGFAAKGLTVNPLGRVFANYTDSQRSSATRAWAVPAEGTPQDSLFLPEFLSREMTRRGVSCAYVGFAEGSTKVADWKPGTARYAKLVEVLNSVGGFEGFYWHLGGTDATDGTAAAAYEADLDAILNDLTTRNPRSFHAVITAMAARVSTAWAAVQRIRRAAKAVADRRANAIYAEPRLIPLADDVHQTPEGNIALARSVSRHFAAIEAGVKAVGPSLASAAVTGTTLTLTFNLASGASLVGSGAWHSRIGVYPAGATPTTGRISVASGTVSGATATLQLATDPDGPVDVYVYDHPDPSGNGAETATLTDNVTTDGFSVGRQAVPTTSGPVVSTYEAGATPPPPVSYPALSRVAGTEAYTAGKFGQAVNNAGSFYAVAPTPLSPTTPAWGAESWIRIPTVTRSNIAWGEDGSSAYFVVRASGKSPAGLACVTYKGLSAEVSLSGGPRIDDNQWHHVAVQFRADGADLFVDGALVASNSLPIDPNRPRDRRWSVGMFDSTTTFIWSGQVDEHLIWDGLRYTASFTPRTTSYDALPAGTVAYWAFENDLVGGVKPPASQPISPYQPNMTTGRIAPITTSFGGRPNVTPATYYFDGQDELASMSMGA